MGAQGRPSIGKRQKEQARLERQREKERERVERRAKRLSSGEDRVPGEDPDLAGIVPGPQPPADD